MACWVEHDAKARAVTVRWLMERLVAPALENKLNGGLEILHEDFEVHHLRLVSGLLGPDRGLIRILGLDVPRWVAWVMLACGILGVLGFDLWLVFRVGR